MIEVYTDGLAEPNPGIGTYGFTIYKNGRRLTDGHGFAGEPVTNNFAEYEGLVKALQKVREYPDEEIVVYSDSKLVVNQMEGVWKFKKGAYVDKFLKARELAKTFPHIRFKWIRREENSEADELSRVAYAHALRRKKGGL